MVKFDKRSFCFHAHNNMSATETTFKVRPSKGKKSKKRKTELGNIAIDADKQEEFIEKVKVLPSESAEEKVTGVVYVGHIPHGFYEKEMKQFFSQFGTVKRIRLSRSRKNAASKGYAFVEFAYEDVAKIAAETMDNYMMFDRLLQCKFIPKERVHPRMWQGANREFKKIDWAQKERELRNKPKTIPERNKHVKNLLVKEKKKRNHLETIGIDYKFPGYAAQSQPLSKHRKFQDPEDQ